MTNSVTPVDLIRYDVLTQLALRTVIQKVLSEVQASGLPGDHHFFITFDTQSPGVRLSERMRERYPEEMTIVIQHTFWNLEVTDTEFEIDLSFDDIRERLRIPYMSIKAFFDPSVKFGLQFEPQEGAGPAEEKPTESLPVKAELRELRTPKPAKEKQPASDGDDEDAKETAEVVSLDSFRKNK